MAIYTSIISGSNDGGANVTGLDIDGNVSMNHNLVVAGNVSDVGGSLAAERGRIDAILAASDADKDSFAEIVTLINSVDTENDTAFAAYALTASAALNAEESARAAADTSLTTRISNEETARGDADASLTTRLSNEEDARASVDLSMMQHTSASFSALGSSMNAGFAGASDALADEVSARGAADSSLQTRLSAEEVARGDADSSLTTRLSNEEDARESVDASIMVVVNAVEAARAAGDASLTTELSSTNTALTAEVNARGAADSSVIALLKGDAAPGYADLGKLEDMIQAEEARIDAMLSGSSVDFDTLKEVVDAYQLADTSIIDSITSGSAARITGDSSLTARLSVEEVARTTQLSVAQADRTTIRTEFATADASVITLLKGDAALDYADLGKVEDKIQAEETARASVDSSLQTRLSAEEVARGDADSSLTTRLSNEEVARGDADSSLTTRLSNEEVARGDADSSVIALLKGDAALDYADLGKVEDKIQAEETARASVDSSLQTRLSAEEDARASVDAAMTSTSVSVQGSLDARILVREDMLTKLDGTTAELSSGYNLVPEDNGTQNLGSQAKRWRNIYTSDINFTNERGSWTLIEESGFISFRDNNTGRRYKMMMEDITDTGNYGPDIDGKL